MSVIPSKVLVTSRLYDHSLFGISSMIRDLTCLSPAWSELEDAIVGNSYPLPKKSIRNIAVVDVPDKPASPGDIVLFRMQEPGAYTDMETVWGDRVPLVVGQDYVGVLTTRNSSKFFSSEIPQKLNAGGTLDYIAQAGGIGVASGDSPALGRMQGTGRPPQVQFLGRLVDEASGALLNLRDFGDIGDGGPTNLAPPVALVVGTGTDVGKTTFCVRLIQELAGQYRCAAAKISGTHWYEDTKQYIAAGAFPGLCFSMAGLPTSYFVEPTVYRRAISRLMSSIAAPESIHRRFLDPETRSFDLAPPEVVVAEHGGDLIEGNVPSYLSDSGLMESVAALVICAESAVAVVGALSILRDTIPARARTFKTYVSLPLISEKSFTDRMASIDCRDELAGIVDSRRSHLTTPSSSDDIVAGRSVLSCKDFVAEIRPMIESLGTPEGAARHKLHRGAASSFNDNVRKRR